MIREAGPEEKIELAEFVYRPWFMSMEHNYLCAVCRAQSAVIDCNRGVLNPCWSCQENGWELKKASWLRRFIQRKSK